MISINYKLFQIFAKLILPSIVPTLAAVGMFFALNMWNMWLIRNVLPETAAHFVNMS